MDYNKKGIAYFSTSITLVLIGLLLLFLCPCTDLMNPNLLTYVLLIFLPFLAIHLILEGLEKVR